jgi:serine/threonine protein kinase
MQDPVALKLIKARRADSEPYQRFVREVEFLRTLTAADGALPLLEYNMPVAPTRDNRPWLAMPIATSIREALVDKPLEIVVEAISSIAGTLAILAEREIAHRDIKPGNLYRLNDQWLVGDFGLIDVPDMDELTRQGKPLGPAHYTAYEMIISPSTADGRPADVYSLGKTLWVLATGENYPPDGHQPANTAKFSIADMRPHPHAARLDELIDGMTQIHWQRRPSMAQVARDLGLWAELVGTPAVVKLGDIHERVRKALQVQISQDHLRSCRLEQAQIAIRRVSDLMRPLNEALQAIHPQARINEIGDRSCRELLRIPPTFRRQPSLLYRYHCSHIVGGPSHRPLTLKVGRGVELMEDGALAIKTMISCGYENISPVNYFWLSEPRTAPVGSIEAEQMLQSAVQELADRMPEGLEAFLRGMA